ncbi:MAG: cytochrome ubiquinol oxidase subunit I [Chloroflexi bacterium]|nr:cytochrome ubiquinol oxidase subunit I [Chloroflexota bacterium]
MKLIMLSSDKQNWRPLVRAAFVIFFLLILFTDPALAQSPDPAYREFPLIGSRVALWLVAEVHLMFAAFMLGVPMFAVVVEMVGWRNKDARYDALAKEFVKLVVIAASTTAILGALLTFVLTVFYPKFFNYLANIFSPTFIIYPILFFGESFTLYLYYYGWDRMMEGAAKVGHIIIGIVLNIWGTILMFVANAWLTFAISPAGVDDQGNLVDLWAAITNPTWMPINVHRLIANVAFGGSIVAAYSAIKFLNSKNAEEKAHYDWMGYVGNFIAIIGLIPLPFAGYWLGREIYGFNQQMGITMMGGFLSWLWIIQALLIGILFLTANYYLWVGMGRISGGERYRRYIKYLAAILVVGWIVWATPHSIVASLEEARKIGQFHPLLGVLGVMSAKNTVVNLMILTTFISFLMYRRAGKEARGGGARRVKILQAIMVVSAASVVLFYGVYGYVDIFGLFGDPGSGTPAIIRIGFSVYQVAAVLAALFFVTLLDIFLFRRATTLGPMSWGQMPERSQYALVLLAVTFTWLMGLMGYARNAIRQDWHVFGILKDTSLDAYSPTLGFAAIVISVCVILFFGLIAFIFWLGELGEKKAKLTFPSSESKPAYEPAGSGGGK